MPPRSRWALVVLVALWASLVFAAIGAPTPARGATIRFVARADAGLHEAHPGRNYGHSPVLRVKEGTRSVVSVIRFRLPEMDLPLASATLRLFATEGTSDGPFVVPASSEWSEDAVDWASKPRPTSAPLDDAGSIRAGKWVELDVRQAIGRSRAVTFELIGETRDAVSFASRETSRPPRLIVIGADGEPEPSESPSPSPTRSPTRSPTPSPTRSPTPSPTPSRSPSPSFSPTPIPPSGDVVIAAAGDIACDPDDQGFNDLEGSDTRCHMMATSDLLLEGDYDAVLTLGDNQYNSGTLSEFMASYDPTWGRVKSITHPTAGNHEYGVQEGEGYYDYFGAAAAPLDGYYSFDLGDWHLIALNSNCEDVGCSEGSDQFEWLEDDLADSDAECTLAYWHHPRFSSGHDGDSQFVADMYEVLYDAGAEILLAGHSHNYERFEPQDPDGNEDQSQGIREFVVGTGGAFFTGMSEIKPNSVVRNNRTFGILELALDDDSYGWRFVPEPGGSFTDSGSGTCH